MDVEERGLQRTMMPHQAGLTMVLPERVPLPALMSRPRPRLPETVLSWICSPEPW